MVWEVKVPVSPVNEIYNIFPNCANCGLLSRLNYGKRYMHMVAIHFFSLVLEELLL